MDHVFLIPPLLPAVFDSSRRIRGGSRLLIPETCPSMDTPLPLAGDLQLGFPGAAGPPHPQIRFQLSRREVTPHRQPHEGFGTHVVWMPVCMHMYSQPEVSRLISKFWRPCLCVRVLPSSTYCKFPFFTWDWFWGIWAVPMLFMKLESVAG